MSHSNTRTSMLPALAALSALALAIAGLRAVAQSPTSGQPPAQRTEAPAKPAAGKPASDADSAQTIEDDPTVAPDPDESADNNITFPVDI